MRVVGLDLSLASTGMAEVSYPALSGDATVSGSGCVKTKPGQPTEQRLSSIVDQTVAFTEGADLVVIENGALQSVGPGREELAALRYMVRVELWSTGVPFALVRPTTLKMYTTGRGNASKDEMVSAVDERHGTSYASMPKARGRYDLADATALAAMGMHRLARRLPKGYTTTPRLESLTTVRWPDERNEDAVQKGRGGAVRRSRRLGGGAWHPGRVRL